MASERCAICGCPLLRRSGVYARPTLQGRAHATRHHFVAERFFGRSRNRPGDVRDRIFARCPWGFEGIAAVFCYECHEELLHNPVFLSHNIEGFATLVRQRGLAENAKPRSRKKIAGRIMLLHDVIEAGLETLMRRKRPIAML